MSTTPDRVAGIRKEIDPATTPIELAKTTRGNVIRVALVAALGGLLYGYDTGVISGTLIEIGRDFDIGSGVKEVITASILVGAIVGAFSTGRVAHAIGRRRTIIVIAAIFLLGVVFAGISPSPVLLILSRLFLGLAVGGSMQTIPTYVAELAPAEKRGRFVTLFNCAIGVGVLAAAIVGVLLNGVVSWRWMIVVAGAPAIVLLVGMLGRKAPLARQPGPHRTGPQGSAVGAPDVACCGPRAAPDPPRGGSSVSRSRSTLEGGAQRSLADGRDGRRGDSDRIAERAEIEWCRGFGIDARSQ